MVAPVTKPAPQPAGRRSTSTSHFRLMSSRAAEIGDATRIPASKLRETLATYEKQRDLILLGAYQYGTDPKTDYAIDHYDAIINFLKQSTEEDSTFEDTVQQLSGLFES